jgi:adenylate cyclase class 2
LKGSSTERKKMNTEFEVKILDIDVAAIQNRLAALGAKQTFFRKQRRYVYDLRPPDTWLRLRDDGERATLTVKEILDDTITGTKEVEVVVDDFERTKELLEKTGLVPKAYQENRRTSYRLGDVEVQIDEWPRIPPYLEIEAKNEQDVERVVRLLGFTMEQTTSINTKKVYARYGIDIEKIPELKFSDQE